MNLTDNIFLIAFSFLLGALLAGIAVYLLSMGKSSTRQASPAELDPNLAEALRIWRQLKSGEMLVEIDGQLFRSPGGMNESQRQLLSRAAGGLNTWLAMSVQAPPARVSTSLPPRPIQDVHTPGGDVQPVKASPLDAAARLFNPATPAPQFKSIPMQIDEILQSRLAASPLASRKISLVEVPGKGVTIMVDGVSYAGVDDLPEPEVSALVRAAVAEWEQKSRADRQ